jgi:hypothetical protein
MTSKTDSKKRIVLPDAKPGEVYDIQRRPDGGYLLVKLERPAPSTRPSKEECLRAMAARPLEMSMSWDELASQTREP